MNVARKSPKSRLTLNEFFALPDEADGTRYELVDGELRAMSPASSAHSLIQGNAFGLIRDRLRASGSSCRALPEASVAPRVGWRANLRVPDIVVTCAPIRMGQMTVDDPVLIVEVLSPTNEHETRDNVRDYSTIPTVREILILHSTRIEAELFRKGDDAAWPDEPDLLRRQQELMLQTVGLRCLVDEFYEGMAIAP